MYCCQTRVMQLTNQALLLIIVFLTSTAYAQDCLNYADYGRRLPCVEGVSGAFCVVDDLLYSAGERLQIHDMTDPESIVLLGALDLVDRVEDIAVQNSLVFTICGSYLRIYDVSDAAAPYQVGEYLCDHGAHSVVVEDGYLFVVGRDLGLLVLDVQDPAQPTLVSRLALPTGARDIEIQDSCVFIAVHDYEVPTAENGFYAVDVHDPEAPVISDMLPVSMCLDGCLGTDGKAYLADYYNFRILDISDPSDLRLLSSSFMPSEIYRVAVDGNRAVAMIGCGAVFLDVSSASSPQVLEDVSMREYYWEDILLKGDLALASTEVGLEVTDLSRPVAPVRQVVELGADTWDMVSMPNRLMTFSSGYNNTIVETFEPAGDGSLFSLGTSVLDTRIGHLIAYGDYGVSVQSGRLEVLDFSDPFDLRVISSLDDRMFSYSGWLDDGLFYGGSGIIADVKDPHMPYIVGELVDPTDGYRYPLQISQGLGYYRRWSDGVGEVDLLEIVDVSDPPNMTNVGAVEMPHNFYLALLGYPSLATSENGQLTLLDLNDPEHPSIISQVTPPVRASRFVRDGQYIYMLTYRSSVIWVMDVFDPEFPVFVGEVELPLPLPHESATAIDLTLVGDRLNALINDPVSSMLFTCYRQCGAPVANQLVDYQAVAGADGVELSWQTLQNTPAQFRIMASCVAGLNQGQLWEVPYIQNGPATYEAIDRLSPDYGGCTVEYRLEQMSENGQWLLLGQASVNGTPLVAGTTLDGAAPNPFNPDTKISFTVGRQEQLRLAVYDLRGQLVTILADAIFAPGSHTITWNGRTQQGQTASSGTYLLQLNGETTSSSIRVSLLK